MAKLHLHRKFYHRTEKEEQHMFKMQEIGARIAAARRARGLTQPELAEQMGISFQAVSGWERGVSMPDIARLPELCAILGMSVDALLGNVPMPETQSVEPEPEPQPAYDAYAVLAEQASGGMPSRAIRDAAVTLLETLPIPAETLPRLSGYLDSADLRALAEACLAAHQLSPDTLVEIAAHLDTSDLQALAEAMVASGQNPSEMMPRLSRYLPSKPNRDALLLDRLDEMDSEDICDLALRMHKKGTLDAATLGRMLAEMEGVDIVELARGMLERGPIPAKTLDAMVDEMDEDDLLELASELAEQGKLEDSILRRIAEALASDDVAELARILADCDQLSEARLDLLAAEMKTETLSELLSELEEEDDLDTEAIADRHGAREEARTALPYDMGELVKVYVMMSPERKAAIVDELLDAGAMPADLSPIYVLMPIGKRDEACARWLKRCTSIADFVPVYAVSGTGARRKIAEHYLAQGNIDGFEAVLPFVPYDLRDRVIAEKIKRK